MSHRNSVILAVILAIFVFSVSNPHGQPSAVHAMGQPMGTCSNEYNATVTAFRIIYPTGSGSRSFNVLANPNPTLTMVNGQRYNVSMILQVAGQSSNGNQQNGSMWYASNYPGFGDGMCVADAFAGQQVSVSVAIPKASTLDPSGNSSQAVYWEIGGNPRSSPTR